MLRNAFLQFLTTAPYGDARSALDCGDLSPLWAVEACRRHQGRTRPGFFYAKPGATSSSSSPRADQSAPPQSGDKSPHSKALRASPISITRPAGTKLGVALGGAASLDCDDLSPLWAVEACRRDRGRTKRRLFQSKPGAPPSPSRPRADKSAPPQSGDKSPHSKALRARHILRA